MFVVVKENRRRTNNLVQYLLLRDLQLALSDKVDFALVCGFRVVVFAVVAVVVVAAVAAVALNMKLCQR